MLANGMVAKILIFSLVSVGGIDDKLVIYDAIECSSFVQ